MTWSVLRTIVAAKKKKKKKKPKITINKEIKKPIKEKLERFEKCHFNLIF